MGRRIVLFILGATFTFAQQKVGYQVKVTAERVSVDSLLLYYLIRDTVVEAGTDTGLGTSNFAVQILPLDAFDYNSYAFVKRGKWDAANSPCYLSMNLSLGAPFINVNVYKNFGNSACAPGVAVSEVDINVNPNQWDTIAVVYVRLYECPDTLKIFWRTQPDSLGGAGTITDWYGKDLKPKTRYIPECTLPGCSDVPDFIACINITSDSLAADTVGMTAFCPDTPIGFYIVDNQGEYFEFYEIDPNTGDTLFVGYGVDTFYVDLPGDRDTLKVLARLIHSCGCDTALWTNIVAIPIDTLPFIYITGPTQVAAGATNVVYSSVEYSTGSYAWWLLSSNLSDNVVDGGASNPDTAYASFDPGGPLPRWDTLVVDYFDGKCSNQYFLIIEVDSCRAYATPRDTAIFVCVGNSARVYVDSLVADSLYWEVSTDSVVWARATGGISPTSQVYETEPFSSVDTLYYRAIVWHRGCSDTSGVWTVRIVEPLDTPQVFADTLICLGDSALIQVKGRNIDSIAWYSSLDGITWSAFSVPAPYPWDSFYVKPGVTTYYRGVLYGYCDSMLTDAIRVRVNTPPSAPTMSFSPNPVPEDSIRVCQGDTVAYVGIAGLQIIDYERGYWVTTGSGAFIDPFQENTSYITNTPGVDTLYWVAVTSGCENDTSNYLRVYIEPPPLGEIYEVPAGICKGDTTDTIRARIIQGSSYVVGYWDALPYGSSRFLPDNFSTDVRYYSDVSDAAGVVELLWIVKDTLVCINRPDTQRTFIMVYDSAAGNIVSVSPDTVCQGDTVQLVGNVISGFGFWSSLGSGVLLNPLSSTTGYVTGSSDSGLVDLLWIVVNGVCPPVVEVAHVQVDLPPQGGVVHLSPDSICAGGNTVPLGGYVVRGQGYWTTPNGNGYFYPDSTAPDAQYYSDTSDAGKWIYLWWVVQNGSCVDSVYVDSVYVKSAKIWGTFTLADDSVCVLDTTAPLGAVAVYGTGTWSTTGNGTFLDPNDGNTRYVPSPLDGGQAIALIWTITQSGCDPLVLVDTLYVEATPVATVGLSSLAICVGDSTPPLNASSGNGIGHWEHNGFGVIKPDIYNPFGYYVSSLSDGGDTVLVWWIVEGNRCPSDTAEVEVIVNNPPQGSFAGATPNPICAGAPTDPLGATITSGDGGYWSCQGCNGGYFIDSLDGNTQYVTATTEAGTDLILIWNVYAAGCDTARYKDTLTVSNTTVSIDFPPPAPICAGDTTPSLGASAPGAISTYWTTSNGLGSFVPDTINGNSSYASSVNDPDTVWLTWNADFGAACGLRSITQPLIVYPRPQGNLLTPSDTLCYPSASDTLLAQVIVGDTGVWLHNGTGGLNFVSDTSVVYIPGPGDKNAVVELYWIVYSGTCVADTDTVYIVVNTPPLGSFVPVGDVCAGSPTDTLRGQIISGVSGYWSTTGVGSFLPRNDTNVVVYQSSASEGGSTIEIYWIVTAPGCTPDTSMQTLNVINATVSGTWDTAAVPDSLCELLCTVPLGATVTSGVGHWECDGCLGSFVYDPLSNDTIYCASIDDPPVVTLKWVITDASGTCNALVIPKDIYIVEEPEGQVLTTGPLEVCEGDTSDTLIGLAIRGVGRWDCANCNGSFIDPTKDTTQYVSVAADAGQWLELWWIAEGGICPSDTKRVFLYVSRKPQGSFTGPLAPICAGDTTSPLGATVTVGEGYWDCPNCSGGFTLPLSGNSKYVSIIADSSKTLQLIWNMVNGSCDTLRDTVDLYVYAPPLGDFSTIVPPICALDTTIPLGAQLLSSGTGFWTTSGNGYFIPDSLSPNAQYVADTTDVGNVLLTWNVVNGPCDTARYTQVLEVYGAPLGSFALGQDSACAGEEVVLNASVVAPAGGVWSTNNGQGTFSSLIDPNATYTPANQDTGKIIYITWSIGNAVCDTIRFTDSIYVKSVYMNVTPSDTTVCAGDTVYFQATGMDVYTWFPSTYLSNAGIANPYAVPSDTIQYVVIGRDTIARCEVRRIVTLNVKESLPITAGPDTSLCFGDSVQLWVNAPGATQYRWYPDTGLSAVTIPNPVASPPQSIVYTVEALMNNGCWSRDRVRLIVYPTPSPILVANDNCVGNVQQLYTLNDTFCVQKYWFLGDMQGVLALGAPDSTHPLYVGSGDTLLGETSNVGSYTYSVFCVSAQGCVGGDDATYQVYEAPNADFVASDTVRPWSDPVVQFTPLMQGGVRYLWNFGDPASGVNNTDTSANPIHRFSSPGVYTIALYVENDVGCNALKIKTNYITILDEEYYFPTAFTPNGDGLNDYFRPLPADGRVKVVVLQIFDRWGKLVYETNSNEGWDGYTKDGKPFDPGTYTYRCIIDHPRRGRTVYTGRVTLIR